MSNGMEHREGEFLQRDSNQSCQARVVRRRRVFRDNGLLPGRLQDARGYLGDEDFMRLGNLTAYCIRKWTCDIVFRDYDSECNHFSCTISNRWSGNNSGTRCRD